MSKLRLHGTSSGYTDIAPTAAAGNNTLTAPTGTGTLVIKDGSGAIGITSVQATNANFSGTTRITSGISTTLRVTTGISTTLQVGGVNVLNSDGVNTSGIVTAAAFVPSVGWLGNRNMIINGGMTVSQRGTQTSITSSTYTLDRWKLAVTTCGAYTVSQLAGSDELTNTSGRNSLKVDCTTADASPASGDLVILQQPLEGLVTNPLCWGTSGGKKAVISFWAKADINGWSSGTKDFVVEIQGSDSQEFSVVCQLAATGTWQKFVVPIDAKTSSAINYDNTESMGINWWLDAGSNYKGGTGVTGWSAKANSGGVRAAGQTLAIAAHTDNNFYLTNVQFEVGEYATPFESRSYGDELQRCKRYYQRLTKYNQQVYGSGYFESDTIGRHCITLPVRMRSAPTATFSAANTFTNVYTGTLSAGTSVSTINTDEDTIFTSLTVGAGGGTDGQACLLGAANSTTSEIYLTAEI